jgi:cytoskeletal protein CcmA (bactofilin family)
MPKPLGHHRPINGASTFSILGNDTALNGDIKATTDLQVEGRVEGNIACCALVQGEGSEIVGNVSAESIRIAGKVQGSVTAREVVILKSARIHGDIHYEQLTIEQGAQLDGRLSPRGAHAQARVPEGHEARLTLAPPQSQQVG